MQDRRRRTRSTAGAQVVFAVAGPCGLGALDAAKEADIWGVGVDVDQSYLGTYILTSAVKRVDRRGLQRDPGRQAGKFKGGIDLGVQPEEQRRGARQDQPEASRRRPQGKVAQPRRSRSSPARSSPRRGSSRHLSNHRTAGGHVPALPRPLLESRTTWPPTPTRLSSSCAGITKRFPGVLANDHVDFDLRARRGARAARRERRRQVDADEHPLRAVPARRGRDPPERQAGRVQLAARTRSTRASAWCTSTSCSSR